MELDDAIHSRRTVKTFAPEPISRAVLEELFELARWAPNHHLTEPWRFRVLGPQSLERLEAEIGSFAMVKVRRAPTLVVASCVQDELPERREEDMHATACAIYALLLGATARGIANYWRTPGFLRTPAGAQACGVPSEETTLGLIYLGHPATSDEVVAPDRQATGSFVEYLS